MLAAPPVQDEATPRAPLLQQRAVRWRSGATLQRVFGLTIKAALLTAQRLLDLLTVWRRICHSEDYAYDFNWWLLIVGAIAATGLSALTLSRHRAAVRQNRPYGCGWASLVAVLQVAPLVEMADKLGDGFFWGVPDDDMANSILFLLDSSSPSTAATAAENARGEHSPRTGLRFAEMKGSRYGENLMRGLRKLSIASLPLLLLSTIVHSITLLGQIAVTSEPCDEFCDLEAGALAVSLVCLAMACADVVLYVWVDDAFVRTHKKLVQFHYFVEILAREPIVLLLHVACYQSHGWRPLVVLWACDVFANVLLLLLPTLRSWSRRRLSCRHALSQMSTAVIMSQVLFGVNITFFDPRDAFLVANTGFYIVKYVEVIVMFKVLQTHHLNMAFFQPFCEAQLAMTILNAALVWVVIPWRHRAQDRATRANLFHFSPRQSLPRLSRLLPGDQAQDDRYNSRPSRILSVSTSTMAAGTQIALALELGTVGGPQTTTATSRLRGASLLAHCGTGGLEVLGDILEGLCLLSQAQSDRNRPALSRTMVADVLWSLMLPWEGDYDDGEDGLVQLKTLDSERGSVLVRRTAGLVDSSSCADADKCGDQEAPKTVESIAFIFQGTAIELVLNDAEGRVIGTYNGRCIQFADERQTVWRRRGLAPQAASASSSSAAVDAPVDEAASANDLATPAAREVLRLVQTQLLLALRWEPTFLGLGPNAVVTDGALAAVDTSQRPILGFLLRYAIGACDLVLLSEVYWSLWCLSQDPLDAGMSAYEKARWVLVSALEGGIEFWDGIRGIRLDTVFADPERGLAFRRSALDLLVKQAALWRQTLQLASLGITTPGDTAERSRAVRQQLSQWRNSSPGCGPSIWHEPEDLYLRGPAIEAVDKSQTASLVRPGGSFLSAPIDPGVRFHGVDIPGCEILPSNTAPLLLSCWKASRVREEEEEAGSRSPVGRRSWDGGRAGDVQKYMVKLGDDLRQDQLVIQMLHLMEVVWKESLPPAESAMLRFVPYRVLAMTPRAGYVKFVPGAVSLSKALSQSNGDLLVWLEANRPLYLSLEQVLNNLCGSAAAYCVATYVLGIGDRHLDNLQITPEGHFFHIDFGFIFGEDPKPFAPRLRLPQQVANVLLAFTAADDVASGAATLLDKCFLLAGRAYIALRRSMPLWVSLLRVTGHAGGAGCQGLRADADAAVVVVQDRLRSDLGCHEEEAAAAEFLLVLGESTEALYPVLTDKVHQLGLFWK